MIFFSSCTKDTFIPRDIDEAFYQGWVHAREEDQSRHIQNYRPFDKEDFPAIRFRQHYVFNRDGTCQYLSLSPSDNHFLSDGEWTYEEETRLLQIWSSNGQRIASFKVVGLSADRLVLNR